MAGTSSRSVAPCLHTSRPRLVLRAYPLLHNGFSLARVGSDDNRGSSSHGGAWAMRSGLNGECKPRRSTSRNLYPVGQARSSVRPQPSKVAGNCIVWRGGHTAASPTSNPLLYAPGTGLATTVLRKSNYIEIVSTSILSPRDSNHPHSLQCCPGPRKGRQRRR